MSVVEHQALRQVVIACGVALFAYFVLAISLTWAAPLQSMSSSSDFTSPHSVNNPTASPERTLSVSSLPPDLKPPAIAPSHHVTWTDLGVVVPDGGTILLGGIVACSANGDFWIGVSVQQRNNIAIGSTRGSCQKTEQEWRVSAEAVGSSLFQAGQARACAQLYLHHEDGSLSRDETCRIVRLVVKPQ